MKNVSDKRRAKLAAEGVKLYGSTIAPKKAKPAKKAGRMGAVMQRKTKIAKANPERQRKAARRGAAKHRAYMASETRRLVEARSGGRCEFACNTAKIPTFVIARYACFDGWSRCSGDATDHHHLRYGRYGGRELPEDIQHVCRSHHDYLESLKPAGNRRSRSRGRAA